MNQRECRCRMLNSNVRNKGGTHGFDAQDVASTVPGTDNVRLRLEERESVDAREGLELEIGHDCTYEVD